MEKLEKSRIRQIRVEKHDIDKRVSLHIGSVFGYFRNGEIRLTKSQRRKLQRILLSENCEIEKGLVREDKDGNKTLVILCRPLDSQGRVGCRLSTGFGLTAKKGKKSKRKKQIVISPDPIVVPRRITVDPEKIKGVPFRKARLAKFRLNGRR